MSYVIHQPPSLYRTSVRPVVLWSRPEDVEAFETYYAGVHMPLAGALPGSIRGTSSRLATRAHHRMAELTFASRDELNTAMASPAGKALAADATSLEERFAVTSTSMVAFAADSFEGDDHGTA